MENIFPSSSSPFLDHFPDRDHNINAVTGLLDYCERSNSSAFTELLNMQDFGPSPSHVLQAPIPSIEESSIRAQTNFKALQLHRKSLQVSNIPATPNSSSIISSESNDDEVVKDLEDGREEEEEKDEEEERHQKTKKQLKSKKMEHKKKQREPRFAFMTKSEVDHLEDGYRWRKYGQKTVKNSSFPRSYYRCSTASCNVKKRIERSLNDPSVVVTTYEGQHTHESPVIPRSRLTPSSAFPSGGAAPYPPSLQMLLHAHHIPFCSSTPFTLLTDDGPLVQDMVPSSIVGRQD